MAIRPGPPTQQRTYVTIAGARPPRRRRRALTALVLVLIGLCGLVVAGFVVRDQLRPRTFTAAQQSRIQGWEIARRWQTMPKTRIFPYLIHYRLADPSKPVGSKGGSISLYAKRLAIARQASCADAADGSHGFMSVMRGRGCQALLRSTYADASSSLVVTAGIAVMKDQTSAVTTASYLTGGPALAPGGMARRVVLRPFRVPGTPAALYGSRQRQFTWVVAAGSYLVLATVGYADGRPHVPVTGDSYALEELTSLARGVAMRIAAPLGVMPPAPHCPGAPSC